MGLGFPPWVFQRVLRGCWASTGVQGIAFPERQQLQEGKILVELREREECHLLQHPCSLPQNTPAKIETSCFVVGNIKEREKKERGGGCGEKQPKKRKLLNGILCQLRVYK